MRAPKITEFLAFITGWVQKRNFLSRKKQKPMINAVIAGVIVFQQSAYADLPDPTKPAYQVPPQTQGTTPTDAEPKLSAIWFLPKSRWATINDVQAREGQSIGANIKIIKIRKNSVTISHNGIIKTLKLLKRPLMFP